MIGLLCPVLAIAVACLVWRREPRHGPVVAIHLAQACFSLATLAGAHPVARLLLLAAISATTAAVYVRLWDPEGGEWLAGSCVAYVAFVWQSEPTREDWELAIELPFLAACATGIRCLLLAWRERTFRRSITDVAALLLLASDVVGAVWIGRWPSALHWLGRAQALGLVGVGLWWLWRSR